MPVNLLALANSRIATGSQAVVAVFGPCLGGLIVNPARAADQQIASVEALYVDLVTDARIGEGQTSFAIQPGQSFTVPYGFPGRVSVNAQSSGHAFSGFVIQPPQGFQPIPVGGGVGDSGQVFPPGPGQISTLTAVIPAYLYQQYSDDDDLQAFVAAFNTMCNWYAVWFARLNPADYTQGHIEKSLLDWVAAGLYGMLRPTLPLGHSRTVGPLNTWVMNTWALNQYRIIPPGDFQLTDDDIFKRILTWHIYKDDGDVFNTRWLKRRVQRFLTGADGTNGDTNANPSALAPDQTYEISVTFGGTDVNINFQSSRRHFVKGSLLNTFMLNTAYLNEFDSTALSFPVHPLAPIFKAAVDAGVLELPFQYHFTVNVGT